MTQTIKRTRGRRYPLLLRAEHEDAGSWRKPAIENVPVPNPYSYRISGIAHRRRTTWVPTFLKARLAFELVDTFEEMSAAEAKKIGDAAWAKFERTGGHPADVERMAFAMARDRRPRAGRDAGFSRADLYKRMDDASLAKVRSRERQLRGELADMRRQRDEALEASRASCRARRVGLRDECRVEQDQLRAPVRWATALATGTLREGRQALAASRMVQPRSPRRAGAARERREESDDQVRSNIPRHLLATFERVKRKIKPTPRMSRTEAFLHMVHEDDDQGQDWQALEDESDRKLREMLAKHGARLAPGKPRASSRMPRRRLAKAG